MVPIVRNTTEAYDSIGDGATGIEDAAEIRRFEETESFRESVVSRHCDCLAAGVAG